MSAAATSAAERVIIATSFFMRQGIRTRPEARCCGTSSPLAGTLLVAVRDAPAVEIVGRELDLDPVAGQDADVVPAHLAGDVAKHLVPVVELDLEHRVREGLHDLALHLDLLFLRQSASDPSASG